jgi:small subunit ribosomal protein S6
LSQTQYETTIVVDSLQKSEDTQNMITKIENFIKNNGGTITDIEEWGKKRLAYEINRKQYGTYFHILFEGPSTLPDLLEGEYRLQESILRYLTVKSDPKHMKMREKEMQQENGGTVQEQEKETTDKPQAAASEASEQAKKESVQESEPADAETPEEESKPKQESPEQA